MTLALATLSLLVGVAPAGIAYVASLIIDTVAYALQTPPDARSAAISRAVSLISTEALLVAALAAAQRGISLCQSLLRARLGQQVNELIFAKAAELSLAQFEQPAFYDKLIRAQQGAMSRPLSLVMRTFGLIQHLISLVSFGTLLATFSPWACGILLLAGVPAFLAEVKFSGEAYRLFLWRSPSARMQTYLTGVLTRDDHAKEVKLFGLAPYFMKRHRQLFDELYRENRSLTLRREGWGALLGWLATLALYGAYGWIALAALASKITLGQMTLYLMLFRQGQGALSAALSATGGLYEDHLYLSALYDFLATASAHREGTAVAGTHPGDGVRFEHVSFVYPGSERRALRDVTLHIPPGSTLALVGENGSGKSTLIKLLTRLYKPTSGRITLDGRDLREWDEQTLHRRISVIFQDFTRYQLTVGENIGVGDIEHFDDDRRWHRAAEQALAAGTIEALPQGYRTQLGKWFSGGRELSGGQWQKIALARAFMRSSADILVLDEPTASMDPVSEAALFEHFRQKAAGRLVIFISHRLSVARTADQIAHLQAGRLIELGTHESLLERGGLYSRLFDLQSGAFR